MGQRAVRVLKFGACAAAVAAITWTTLPCVDGPAGDSRKPRPQAAMEANAPGSYVVPAGPGVQMQIGKGRLRLNCVNEYQPILPDNAAWLDKDKTVTVNGVRFKGLDDKGVEVTAAGETEHVYLSATSRCTVFVDGKAVAEVYNPGHPVVIVWVYPKN